MHANMIGILGWAATICRSLNNCYTLGKNLDLEYINIGF